jgi:hypothetical protein
MKTAAILLSTLACFAIATPAAAQFGTVKAPPKTWISGSVGGFLNPGSVPDASGIWDFGTAFSGGLGVHRQIGSGLAIGLEGSFAPAKYELRDAQKAVIGNGNASIVPGLLSARMYTGGMGPMGMYLTGGAGAIAYGMKGLDKWDPDLALMTGAGFEYRPSQRQSLFLEWGKFWTFHQSEGVKSNTINHSQIRAGVRIGL